jgi:hypothetical protein
MSFNRKNFLVKIVDIPKALKSETEGGVSIEACYEQTK